MKTILLSCLIMLIPFLSNAQQSETLPVKEPQNYMEKYKKQKKTANVLTITGGALIGSGAIVMLTGYDPDAFIIFNTAIYWWRYDFKWCRCRFGYSTFLY